MDLDEQALRRDLDSVEVRLGVKKGKWRVEGICFPHVLFYIAAAPLPDGPAGFLLHADCNCYPGVAPWAQLWNGGADAILPVANRPAMIAFSEYGKGGLYHPIDRYNFNHNNWDRNHPEMLWTADKKIIFLLETVCDLLHSTDYKGAALPPNALNVPQRFVAQDPA